ncbi:MAG: methyltransferase domain-containing protein [Thaumarchaeota archaeon]|nr:methyltransferase domain-containing protein [Nitrososphaerota archaeon]
MAPEGTETYLPSEDTALLIRALSGWGSGSVLEIGFGSGAVLQSLLTRFSLVVGTDITSPDRARMAKGSAEVVLADRASCFREGTFDLVAFNPPYLPSEAIRDRTVDGGRGGIEVPMSFLDDALRVLKADGRIVVLLSDHGDLRGFVSHCIGLGLSISEAARAALFYESLVVYEIRRR